MALRPGNTEEFLTYAERVITNVAGTPPIATRMAGFGYGAEELAAGRARYNRARELQSQQAQEYGEYEGALARQRESWDQAAALYMPHLKIARVAFDGDEDARTTLGLAGARKQSLAGWLGQAEQFYANSAGERYRAGLARFGVTPEQLEAGRQAVAALRAGADATQVELGEARLATRQRDEALDELGDWLSDLVAILRVAFDDDREQLAKLGLG